MLFSMGSAWQAHRPHHVVPAEVGAAPVTDAPAQNGEHRAETARLPASGLFDELSSAYASARATFSGFLELLSLEARRAGLALMWMVVWGLVAAICIGAAWLGVLAALVMWAVSAGMAPIAAVVIVAGVNLIVGALLIYVCTGISRDLLFAATRRQVAGKSPATPVAP